MEVENEMTLYKWSVSNVEKYFYHPRTPRNGSEAGMDDVSPQNIIFPMNWEEDSDNKNVDIIE